jgi:hypothetical protein
LNLLFSEEQDFWISALLFQFAEHLLEEVNHLPALRWASVLLPTFLAVV